MRRESRPEGASEKEVEEEEALGTGNSV